MVSEKWQHKQLGQLLKLRGGYAFKSEDFREHGDVAVLRISNIKNNGIDLEDAVYVDRNVAEQAKDYKLREGNVVIAMSGATTGKTAIVRKEDLPLVLNQRVGVFDIYNSEHLSEEYLAYVVQSSSFKNQILVNAIGGAQPNISGKQIEDVEILLPPLNEQRKIAAILSSVDEAIEKTEAIIEQTEKVKKGLMQQLLTKGIGHTKFKKTEIGEIPEEWEVRKLEEVTLPKEGIRRGPFGGALKKEIFVNEGYAVYEQQHVINNNMREFRYFIDEKKFLEMKPFEVIPGDILISCSGTVGKVAIVPENAKKGVINQALLRLRLENKLLSNLYAWYLFSSDFMQSKMTDMSHGSTLKNIVGMTELRKISIPIPPLDEQMEIVSILTSVDQMHQNERQRLSQLQTIKKGLMQSLLTGKVRVKVNEDEVVSS
jgi:type I restriction enzyme S subunit